MHLEFKKWVKQKIGELDDVGWILFLACFFLTWHVFFKDSCKWRGKKFSVKNLQFKIRIKIDKKVSEINELTVVTAYQ